MAAAQQAVHLGNDRVSLVLDLRGPGFPGVAHWGAPLGRLGDEELLALLDDTMPAPVGNGPDVPVRPGLVPEHAQGWLGRPGLVGSRPDGTAWAPRFALESATVEGPRAVLRARSDAGLALTTEVELAPSGLLRLHQVLTNEGDAAYHVEGLGVALPVPARAVELLDMTGRWARERSPQRHPFSVGAWVRDTRGGRPGFESPTVLMAGTAAFSFRHGEVWGLHLAWSGGTSHSAERLPTGARVLAAGELLAPGELVLGPGESYTTPAVLAAYSADGIDGISRSLHEWERARPQHPSSPRPVTLNVWEAVYFDHDLERLTRLADAATEVGIERFVLDDGWFRHRRDDTAGLGDWYVDEGVWPQGLGPLAEVVTSRGMQFGLWFEPEMVNPDSDLARAHPEWLLGASSGLPGDQRHQQVLDLGQQPVWDYLLERLDAILSEYPISYVKWDHNRHLVAASGADGRAGVHRQTLALYALMDELKRRHPGLEIESCASGGARIDLGILERTDRVWTSDCNDALERQQIQRWTGVLLVPELMGTHVGPTRSHTTDRTHDLSFRAATALFGHMGVEWDITSATAEERAELAAWIALHKELRGLLHTGTVVRGDSPDDALWLHGVVARDASAAVYAVVRRATSVTDVVGPLPLPGLDPAGAYRVALANPQPWPHQRERFPLPVVRPEGVVLPGRVLESVGVTVPELHPEHAWVLRVERV